MINKLAKALKGWAAKLILTLTALSFMSLFGVSSYLSNASNNRAVIRVDNVEILQSQFSYLAQNELAMASALLGDGQELTDEMRVAVIYGLSQKLLNDSILDRTADKYNIVFNPLFIQSLIVNDATFKDSSGNFSKEMFRELLAKSGLSEAEYVKSVKRNLVNRFLIQGQVLNINVPQVLLDAESKVDNRRRTFKYVNIKPSEMVVDRSITDEEINQYYEDFSSNYMEPERRDLTVLYVPMQNIYDNIKVSDEDINFYYQENKSDYETPETRQVLQMMFDDEEKANSAYAELQNGKDFYDVASEFVGQSKEDTDLGFAAQDELLPEIASEVYAIEKGQYTKPVKVGNAWQIMKVEDIKESSKTSFDVAASEIEKILKDERLYDESYEVLGSMEDKLAAGATLETLSQELNIDLKKVLGFAEDKTASSDYQDINDLVLTTEFVDAGFSYALGETSQVIETDKGLFALRVDAVNETHPKPLDKVRDDIVNLWSDNEKSAIAQEKLNDVMHDLENGDDMSSVGERYSLDVYTSRPLTRNETFDKVGYGDIKSMFAESLNTPHQIQVGDDYIVAVAIEDYDNSVELSKEETDLIKRNVLQSVTKDFADALLKSYADEYKIRVKYKLMGLTDL